MRTWRLLAAATAALAGTLGGCEDVAGPGGSIERTTQTYEVPAELQGTWSLHVYCASALSPREKGGFGTIVERSTRPGNRHPGPTTMTLALHPERFEVSWRQRGGTWEVGWSGPVALRGGTLRLDERSFQRVRDVFTWSLDGRRLSLRYPATRSAEVDGHGDEVSSVARFSLPRTAVDCPPDRVRDARR